jgi:hypothetical protein
MSSKVRLTTVDLIISFAAPEDKRFTNYGVTGLNSRLKRKETVLPYAASCIYTLYGHLDVSVSGVPPTSVVAVLAHVKAAVENLPLESKQK